MLELLLISLYICIATIKGVLFYNILHEIQTCLHPRLSESTATVVPTHGAVRSHPVGVAAAEAGVWYEGPVAVALVGALGPGQLAVQPPPAGLAVALPVHADAVVGARGVQAIHWEERDKQQYEGKKIYNTEIE